jgi:hypothetical protein
MGTPAACTYATKSFGQFENTVLLPEFENNLLFYRRYIDDIFGVWIPPKTNKLNTWNNFKNPSTTTHFLDLNVTLNGSTIITSTHQKPLNL